MTNFEDSEAEEWRLTTENDKYSPERVFAVVCLISILLGVIIGLINHFE